MTQHRRLRIAIPALLLAATTALTACGTGGNTETPASADEPTSSSPSELEGATPLEPGTIGVLQIQGASEIITRLAEDIKTANASVGWKTDVVDGKGDPAVLGQAMTGFIAKKVDAIFVLAVDSAAIAPQIKQAQEAGIPVIASALTVSDDAGLYTATFAPDLPGYADATVAYLQEKFPSGAPFVQVDIPAVYAAHGFITTLDDALDEAGFTQEGNADGNPTDIVNSIATATTNVVQANPDAKMMISCCDFTPPIQLAALTAAGKGDMLLVGRFDNLSSLQLFDSGANLILGVSNLDTGSMLALDAVYAMKASGTEIPTDNDQSQYTFDVVDKDNVPAAGQFFYDPEEQIQTFVEKWSDEYSR